MNKPFDLLSTVEQGGCSAKFPAQLLDKILKDIPNVSSENLILGCENNDDASAYKLSNDIAIIQSTDFFPPMCSDPYEFGQIAAANALSDIFAMGGKAITALNLVMFPSARIDIAVLKEILKGGTNKIIESGAVLAGGHTIEDYPPKYGLAVTGIIHPEKIISNDKARAGDVLILAKPIGTGVIIAGQKIDEVSKRDYQNALDTMKLLNKNASDIMQKYNIRCATDITGFSLTGHALEIAKASNVSLVIKGDGVPLLNGAYELIDMGCIPGAAFRNLNYVEEKVSFSNVLDYNIKMLLLDAQTSGGILMCCKPDEVSNIIHELKINGYTQAAVIGEVSEKKKFSIYVV